jgi:Dolichyl-phosphate-mannose-protein mannosyltransferase
MLNGIPQKTKTLDIFLICILLAVSLFFRLYKINDLPFGLNNDAAWEGSAAISILKGDMSQYIPYAVEGWRGEGIVRILVAFLTLFFGPDPITIRLSTTIFAFAIIFPLYYLIKLLFNRSLAFITTFFVAISGWNFVMSRSGWRAITVPLFSTLSFYYLFKGLRTKKLSDFGLSGVFLSITTFYTYDAGRILPFLYGVLIIFLFKKTKSLILLKKYLVATLTAFCITSIPMLAWSFNNWDSYISRSKFLYETNLATNNQVFSQLVNNIKVTVGLFTYQANGNDFFINEPLIDKPVAYLIPLGIIIGLLHLYKGKRYEFCFMFTWLIFSLIPGVLSHPNGNRAIGSMPAVYFFAAVPIWSLINLQNIYLPKLKPLLGYITVSIVLLSCTYMTYIDYISSNRREIPGLYPETIVTTDYIKTIWDSYNIYITDNYPRETLTYLLYKNSKDPFLKNYKWFESSAEFRNIANMQTHSKGQAFFMFSNQENEIVANELLKKSPKAEKHYIWYRNDNIKPRIASLVILIPPEANKY